MIYGLSRFQEWLDRAFCIKVALKLGLELHLDQSHRMGFRRGF